MVSYIANLVLTTRTCFGATFIIFGTISYASNKSVKSVATLFMSTKDNIKMRNIFLITETSGTNCTVHIVFETLCFYWIQTTISIFVFFFFFQIKYLTIINKINL